MYLQRVPTKIDPNLVSQIRILEKPIEQKTDLELCKYIVPVVSNVMEILVNSAGTEGE